MESKPDKLTLVQTIMHLEKSWTFRTPQLCNWWPFTLNVPRSFLHTASISNLAQRLIIQHFSVSNFPTSLSYFYIQLSRFNRSLFRLTLLFCQIEPLKNGPFLVLPSSLSKYWSAPKMKRIFQFLWGIVEGQTNRDLPSQPILKNCQNGTV